MEIWDEYLRRGMASAWPRLAGLVSTISALIGLTEDFVPERISRGAQMQALRLLRPAEAVVRRLIVLMAMEIDLSAADRSTRFDGPGGKALRRKLANKAALNAMHVSGDAAKQDQSRTPGFKLFEPLVTYNEMIRRRTPRPPKGPQPRILFLDQAYPVATTTEPGVAAGPVINRLRALESVLADPARHARRHARHRARTRPRPGRPGRVSPLRGGHPPGQTSRYTPPDIRDMLAHFSRELRRGPPRSA